MPEKKEKKKDYDTIATTACRLLSSCNIKIMNNGGKKEKEERDTIILNPAQVNKPPSFTIKNNEYQLVGHGHYLIIQPSTEKNIIIKVPSSTSPCQMDQGAIERIKSAYELTALLDHPNIVKILAQKFEENCFAIIQPYCGTSLSEIEPPIENRYDLFQQFLSALHYLERKNIYNPDANPKNCVVKFDEEKKGYLLTLIDPDSSITKPKDQTEFEINQLEASPGYIPPKGEIGSLALEKLQNYTIALSFIQIKLWLFKNSEAHPVFSEIKSEIDTALKKGLLEKDLEKEIENLLKVEEIKKLPNPPSFGKKEIELITKLLDRNSEKILTYSDIFEKLAMIYDDEKKYASKVEPIKGSSNNNEEQKRTKLESLQKSCQSEALLALLNKKKEELQKEQRACFRQFVNFFATKIASRFNESYSTDKKIKAIMKLEDRLINKEKPGEFLKKSDMKILTQGRTAAILRKFSSSLPEIKELFNFRQAYDKKQLTESPRYRGHYNSFH